jgi:hypothetical protein
MIPTHITDEDSLHNVNNEAIMLDLLCLMKTQNSLYYLPSSLRGIGMNYSNNLNNLPNKIINIAASGACRHINFNIKGKLPLKCSLIIRGEMINHKTLKNIFKLKKNVLMEITTDKYSVLTYEEEKTVMNFSFRKMIGHSKNIYTLNRNLENIKSKKKNENKNTKFFNNMNEFIDRITGTFFFNCSIDDTEHSADNIFANKKVNMIIY